MKILLRLIVFLVVTLELLVCFSKNSLAYSGLNNASSDPDLNIRLRGYVSQDQAFPGGGNNVIRTLGVINTWHYGDISEVDPKAPQLDSVFGVNPAITKLYQLNEYSGSPIISPNGLDNWGSTLMEASPIGGSVTVPESGYDIGNGYQATVLYLDENKGDITINYGNAAPGPSSGSPIEIGYTVHFLGIGSINNADGLIDKYKEGLNTGKVVALPCGYLLGTGGSVLTSIRDSGTFFDARSGYDWWQRQGPKNPSIPAPSPLACQKIPPVLITPGQSPSGSQVSLKISSVPIPKPYVACDQVRPDSTSSESEFHSLRPYQASPCDQEVHQTVFYCGNNFYAKETFNTLPENYSRCETDGEGNKTCYDIPPFTSTISVDIKLDPADLPILGNTQLVPNTINKANLIDSPTRMNEYVSWFLNGAIYQFEDTLPTSIQDVLNFSGPIRKLFPQVTQDQLRQKQINQVVQNKDVRHDQIVAQDTRLSDSKSNSLNVPLSSTEDRVGEVQVEQKDTAGGFGGDTFYLNNIVYKPTKDQYGKDVTTDDIYFAHTEETASLAENLQSTFASIENKTFSGKYDYNQPPARTKGFCDIKNFRTNPGDDLFGDYNDATNPYHQYTQKISGTFEYTTATYPGPVNFTAIRKVDHECMLNGGTEDTCTYITYNPHKLYAYTSLYVYTKSPKIKEIWERLVSGPAGIVKRFFPQDIPILDVPASVKAVYETTAGGKGDGVEAIAGQPFVPKSGDNALLFVPHLGSVYDYFLQGIQCALRPQGMCGNSSLQPPPGSANQSPGPTPAACSEGVPDTVPDSVTNIVNSDGVGPLEAAFRDASQKFNVPVCVLKGVAGIETGFDLINWQEIMSKDSEQQEKYLQEGNTQLLCDTQFNEERGHNSCSARGPFQILTGVSGVYCKNVEPKCPYQNPENCVYACNFCDGSGVKQSIANDINTWEGVSNSSGRSNPNPVNFYDEVMASANVLNYKTSPNNPAYRPKTANWTDAQIYTAGKNYYGNDKPEVPGGYTYGQALVNYCHGNPPHLFP